MQKTLLVEIRHVAVSSRLAQLIAGVEKRALTCLVLQVTSDLVQFHSYAQGNPLESLQYWQPHRETGCSAREPGVWKKCLCIIHVRQRLLTGSHW